MHKFARTMFLTSLLACRAHFVRLFMKDICIPTRTYIILSIICYFVALLVVLGNVFINVLV